MPALIKASLIPETLSDDVMELARIDLLAVAHLLPALPRAPRVSGLTITKDGDRGAPSKVRAVLVVAAASLRAIRLAVESGSQRVPDRRLPRDATPAVMARALEDFDAIAAQTARLASNPQAFLPASVAVALRVTVARLRDARNALEMTPSAGGALPWEEGASALV